MDRVEWISQLVVHETAVGKLVGAAADIALDYHLTVYDTLYLALAKRAGAPLVTADRKLYEQAKSDACFTDLVMWVADLG